MSNFNITVLGAGLIGKAIALDLAAQHRVQVVDINQTTLDNIKHSNIQTTCADISDASKVKSVVQQSDLVIGAVPGFMGFNMLKNVIKAKKNIVDISFFPEDPFSLHDFALENNVTAIVDCGVAPGLDNIILGYYHAQYKVKKFSCYVGGLPVVRQHPFAYKAPFSPIDVIEEYTRPARLVENGVVVTKPALSETELIDYPEVGTLQAFNTDGLRTLVKLPIPDMKEKTLRYPGHITYIKALKSMGFFNEEALNIKGQMVRPIDVTSSILLPLWKLNPNDEEFTLMEVKVEYEHENKSYQETYYLYDRYDQATNTHSMARTTGYTCNAIANLILQNKINNKGVLAPEQIGMNTHLFEDILQYLSQRNVKLKHTQTIS